MNDIPESVALPPLTCGILGEVELNKIAQQNNGEPLSPWFSQQRRERGLPSFGMHSYTYHLRLGFEFKSHIDMSIQQDKSNDFNNPIDLTNQDTLLTDNIMLANNEYFDLSPKAFVIAKVLEYFKLPKNIMAIITGKDLWINSGLMLQQIIVEPSFIGEVKLALSNQNFRPIRLFPNAGIAKIIFYRV